MAVVVAPFGDDYEVTNGTITKYLTVEGLGVVAKRVGTETFWLHTDRLGSIQAITNLAGPDVQHRTYRPFGEKIADTSAHTESRGYIGERQDADTGLTYLHARYYDPALGIFISPDSLDPHVAGVGTNRYAYAGANPINAVDRGGLLWAIVCGTVEERYECHLTDYVEVWGGGEYRPPRTTPTFPNGDPVFPGEPNQRPGGVVVTPVPGGEDPPASPTTPAPTPPEPPPCPGAPRCPKNGSGEGNGVTVSDVLSATDPAVAVGVLAANVLDPKATNLQKVQALERAAINLTGFAALGMAAKFAKAAVVITFGHGARHLTETGLSPSAVEAAIRTQIGEASVDTSKPATRGRFKTGHHGVASETGGGLPRSHFLAQIGVDLGAPAAWSALEDVSVMKEAVE